MSENPWKEAGKKIQDGGIDLSHHTENDVQKERHPHHKIAIAMSVVGLILFVIGLAPFVSDMGLFKASVATDPLANLLGAQPTDNVDPIIKPAQPNPAAVSVPSAATTTTNQLPQNSPAANGVVMPNGNTGSTTPGTNGTPGTPAATNAGNTLPWPSFTPTPSPTNGAPMGGGTPQSLDTLLGNTNPVTTPAPAATITPNTVPPEANPHTGATDKGNAVGGPTTGTKTATTGKNTTAKATHAAAGISPKNVKTGPEDIWIVLALCLFGAVIIRSRKELFSSKPQY
ncbi:MAG: hypothetical protein WCJ84_03880 [Candidatus Peregrinibacteria bacterium]